MPGYDRNAKTRLTQALKAEARRLGFDACGVAEAEFLDPEAFRLEEWLLEGRQGTMHWMSRYFDKRTDPTQLVPGAQSVVCVLHNYYQPVDPSPDPDVGKISRYAWGDDYHTVMKEKLYRLYQWLDQEVGGAGGRVFVDSAPVMDKAWARRSGLGWQGKHANILNRKLGSFFFLGELIVDVPLVADDRVPDFCGSCTRCIDACPTDAIYEPYAVDATRCISYLTIEHGPGHIPEDIAADMHNWIFGCDVCQDVCPWNKFKQPTQEPRYAPRAGVRNTSLREWTEVTLDEFRERFAHSPVERATYAGFQRHVRRALRHAPPATPSDS
ncbi:tRNA epoxyqueuosine(34) reductase QueG [Salisaeta longa]|uniref:tRNA epoxyqueuosine(34) reductase QueG n=1 Tax=Salisaeta longa TaxID=503170 RepID=UPI0003B7B5D5|nr:tRNA epoxyqueuosine(34) reductase QueG [Salisaeta longa]